MVISTFFNYQQLTMLLFEKRKEPPPQECHSSFCTFCRISKALPDFFFSEQPAPCIYCNHRRIEGNPAGTGYRHVRETCTHLSSLDSAHCWPISLPLWRVIQLPAVIQIITFTPMFSPSLFPSLSVSPHFAPVPLPVSMPLALSSVHQW